MSKPPSNTLPPAWADGCGETPVGAAPRVAGALRRGDRLGGALARLGMGRMRYAVPPGLYALGAPDADSPVLLSANYKLSFDRLRSAMKGRGAWLLVLDTDGINVWCAAGKGTFGTAEVVARVEASRLEEIVRHRALVCPQLGAPGVAAHEVLKGCGFRVRFGPVRAEDLPEFLDRGMQATPEMRRVTFTLRERLALTPVEFFTWPNATLAAILVIVALGGIGPSGFEWGHAATAGLRGALLFLAAMAAGCVLTPALLPWLPGRAFSAKGALAGAALAVVYAVVALPRGGGLSAWLDAGAWALLMPTVAAFYAMNFTGSTPFTSLSGVKKEMRTAVPWQIAGAALGGALWTLSGLLGAAR